MRLGNTKKLKFNNFLNFKENYPNLIIIFFNLIRFWFLFATLRLNLILLLTITSRRAVIGKNRLIVMAYGQFAETIGNVWFYFIQVKIH